jgi:hypothetical protein
MLKYLTKFAMDVLPSVLATIIGAYIVNHYIARPGTDASSIVAAVSSADPKKADTSNDTKASAISAGNVPEAGVKARGISEKAMLEQTAAEKSAAPEKPAESSTDKPAETASFPIETRRHHPASQRPAAKSAAAPIPSAPAIAASPVALPNSAPAAEAATAPEEHRDANELARAAIERLRGTGDGSMRAQDASRGPEAPRVALGPSAAPAAPAPAVRPLPPPIMVSTPRAETFDAAGPPPVRSAYPIAGIGDPRRPTPPADIPEAAPAQGPLDLSAEAAEPPKKAHTNVAEDVLLAAKSVFHAVLPK